VGEHVAAGHSADPAGEIAPVGIPRFDRLPVAADHDEGRLVHRGVSRPHHLSENVDGGQIQEWHQCRPEPVEQLCRRELGEQHCCLSSRFLLCSALQHEPHRNAERQCRAILHVGEHPPYIGKGVLNRGAVVARLVEQDKVLVARIAPCVCVAICDCVAHHIALVLVYRFGRIWCAGSYATAVVTRAGGNNQTVV